MSLQSELERRICVYLIKIHHLNFISTNNNKRKPPVKTITDCSYRSTATEIMSLADCCPMGEGDLLKDLLLNHRRTRHNYKTEINSEDILLIQLTFALIFNTI